MNIERTLLAVLLGVVVVVFFLLMARSWKRRGQRDKGLTAYALPAVAAEPGITAAVAYVATTKHGLPLERLLPSGLRFRAQGSLAVASDGITIRLAGSDPLFIPAHALREVTETTWAIDRAVETDGLSCVSWQMLQLDASESEASVIADSYFRVIDPLQRAAIVSAITSILPLDTAAGANSEAHK